MGMGYVIILPEEGVQTIQKYYPDARIVGHITSTPGISLNGEKLF
ncbi:MAG: hypothetical protein BWY45_03533 [Euryarchaeota archaeon ADurb.Bin294]|nr:MAG: hypothetical protein BWY45_03533 [Euryarchaeota archaeon ADurb.Bin294]